MPDTVAGVDQVFVFIFGVSAAILLLITAAMVYFVVRYSRKRHPQAVEIDGNVVAEILWIVIPTLLVLAMFYYGWTSYMGLRTVPDGAMEVKVSARMWSWSFTYPSGRKSSVLVVPQGKPVRLTITSQDVIHGLFVPAYRIKVDAVPGMTSHAWFQPDDLGEHDLFCSVYCGVKHADMLAVVRVVPQAEYDAWLAGSETGPGKPGKAVMERLGCLGCHTLDPSPLVGPGLGGVYGRKVTLVTNGKESTRVADEAYLKEAIVGKKDALVKGYDPVMPSYAGQLTDAELDQIIDIIKNGPEDTVADGAKLAENEGCTGCHSVDGSQGVGPSFKGLWGSATLVLENGKERQLVVNRTYVFEVLTNPDRWRTKGYDPLMPAYAHLTQDQKDALCAYLDSLAPPGQSPGHADHSGLGQGTGPEQPAGGEQNTQHKQAPKHEEGMPHPAAPGQPKNAQPAPGAGQAKSQ